MHGPDLFDLVHASGALGQNARERPHPSNSTLSMLGSCLSTLQKFWNSFGDGPPRVLLMWKSKSEKNSLWTSRLQDPTNETLQLGNNFSACPLISSWMSSIGKRGSGSKLSANFPKSTRMSQTAATSIRSLCNSSSYGGSTLLAFLPKLPMLQCPTACPLQNGTMGTTNILPSSEKAHIARAAAPQNSTGLRCAAERRKGAMLAELTSGAIDWKQILNVHMDQNRGFHFGDYPLHFILGKTLRRKRSFLNPWQFACLIHTGLLDLKGCPSQCSWRGVCPQHRASCRTTCFSSTCQNGYPNSANPPSKKVGNWQRLQLEDV